MEGPPLYRVAALSISPAPGQFQDELTKAAVKFPNLRRQILHRLGSLVERGRIDDDGGTCAAAGLLTGPERSLFIRPRYRVAKITAGVAPRVTRASGGRSKSFSIPCFPLVMSGAVDVAELANRKQRIDGELGAHDIRGCIAICDAAPYEAAYAG